MRRRPFLLALGGAPWLAGGGSGIAAGGMVRRVPIVARKFAFSPNEIRARAGETLVLEIRSLDFVHGFAIPQLDARVDAVPGQVATLSLSQLAAGRYALLCDNFCGDGHDRMTGTLIVDPAAD